MLVRAYQRGDPVQKLYGLVLAGAGSYRTEFVLPQTYVFLVLGLWLLWRTVGRHSRLVKLLLRRKPWWRLLLLPVAVVAIELVGPNYGFSPRLVEHPVEPGRGGGRAPHRVVVPGGAADLAAKPPDSLGLYGIALAFSGPLRVRHVLRHAEIRRRAGRQHDLGRRGGPRGGLMLAFGLWLVPRTVIPHARPAAARTRRRPGRAGGAADPDRADAVDSAAGAPAGGAGPATGRRPGWSPWA